MRILLVLIPLTASIILSFDSKKLDISNQCYIGSGGFGTVCSAEVNGNHLAIKKQRLEEQQVNDLTTILFATSKTVVHVVPTVLVTLSKKAISFGMPRLPADAKVIRFEPQDPLKKAVLEQVGEHTLIEIVHGIANLNKIGIFKSDNKLANVLLDF